MADRAVKIVFSVCMCNPKKPNECDNWTPKDSEDKRKMRCIYVRPYRYKTHNGKTHGGYPVMIYLCGHKEDVKNGEEESKKSVAEKCEAAYKKAAAIAAEASNEGGNKWRSRRSVRNLSDLLWDSDRRSDDVAVGEEVAI